MITVSQPNQCSVHFLCTKVKCASRFKSFVHPCAESQVTAFLQTNVDSCPHEVFMYRYIQTLCQKLNVDVLNISSIKRKGTRNETIDCAKLKLSE